jgi:hypothetical protein
MGDTAIRTSFSHLGTIFLRRLWFPMVVFAGFNVACVGVYRRHERLRWQDAFCWIAHPHALEYRQIHDSTKFSAFFVYLGRFLLSDVDCRTGPGDHLPPPGHGGLESND